MLRHPKPLVDRVTQRDHRRRSALFLRFGDAPVESTLGRAVSGVVGAAHRFPQVDGLTGHRIGPGVHPDAQRVAPGLDVSPGSSVGT
jgi:hypothetical protein